MFHTVLDIAAFCRMNIGLLFLLQFFAAVCYGAACSFNEAKCTIGIGAGLSIFFILMQMLSQISDRIDFIRYLTPLTLFDVKGLMSGEISAVAGAFILLFISIILLAAAGYWFRKRDLSL